MSQIRNLDFTIPPIIGYQFYAYPLGVLYSSDKYLSCLYNDFIQLRCISNYRDVNNDLHFMFQSPDVYGGIPCFEFHVFDKNDFFKANSDINKHIISIIDEEYYLYALIDEFYIPNSRSYKKRHMLHDILLTGYNIYENYFYNWGFNCNGTFQKRKVSFSEFYDALKGQYIPDKYNLIILFKKVKAEKEFALDLEIVKTMLIDYLMSKTYSNIDEMDYALKTNIFHGSKAYNNFLSTCFDYRQKLRNNYIYGLRVYDYLSAYLENNIVTDIRPFHVLWEHKACMYMRVEYMIKNGFVLHSNQLLERFKKIEQLSFLVRNLILKYFICKDNNILLKVARLLNEIKVDEENTISGFLNEI